MRTRSYELAQNQPDEQIITQASSNSSISSSSDVKKKKSFRASADVEDLQKFLESVIHDDTPLTDPFGPSPPLVSDLELTSRQRGSQHDMKTLSQRVKFTLSSSRKTSDLKEIDEEPAQPSRRSFDRQIPTQMTSNDKQNTRSQSNDGGDVRLRLSSAPAGVIRSRKSVANPFPVALSTSMESLAKAHRQSAV